LDVAQFHAGHLHAPGISGLIQLAQQRLIHLLASGEGLIQIELAHLSADLGEHQVHHRRLQVVDGVIGAGVLQQLPIHHRIHLDRHVVAGDALLRRDIQHPLLQRFMAHHALHHRQHEREPRLQLAVVLAEPLHQPRLAAAGHLHPVNAQKGNHRQSRQAKEGFHKQRGALASS